MIERAKRSPACWLVLGLVAGLLIGLNAQGLWPRVPLYATATHGQDSFAIATGPADSSIEAVYFLDFLTGDLKAAVLQPQLGKFMAFFNYNLINDFGGAENKNPKYLMVTGGADLPRARGVQFANSVVYIAEATTGQVACYAMPYSNAIAAQRQAQQGVFVKLDQKPFRTAVIREQE